MFSNRRYSASDLIDYYKNAHHKKQFHQNSFNFYHNNRLARSKSDTFYPQESVSIYQDFSYLSDKRLKFDQNLIYKIPLFNKDSKNKTILKKSRSFDSLLNILNKKHHIPIKKLPKNSIYLHISLSCYNLNDFFNDSHNIYLIKGRIPCYSKILKKIDYSQYIRIYNQQKSSLSDLTDFFINDDRVNEREVEYINSRKVRYFFRNRKNQKDKKNRHKNSNKDLNTPPQKEKPRFNLYCSKNPISPTKKTPTTFQSPRLSSAFILNERYNIRTRVFKENNIRKFYQELAIAEEEDKHFLFDIKENQELLKRKRSRSVERNNPYATIPIKKIKRSKSVQNPATYYGIFDSPPSSPKNLKNRPRFKLYSPNKSSPQISKKIVKNHQSPKPSPASVLNEKYNIRTRLFKEMHIHDFYKDLAAAEKEEKIQKSLEHVQMSPNSKKIVEGYMQRINQPNSKINIDDIINKPHKKSQNDNSSLKSNKSQNDEQTLTKNDDKSQKGDNEIDNKSIKSNHSQNGQKETDNHSVSSNKSNRSNQSIRSNKSQKSNTNTKNHKDRDNQTIKSNRSQTEEQTPNKNDNHSIKSNQSKKESDNQSIRSNKSNISPKNTKRNKSQIEEQTTIENNQRIKDSDNQSIKSDNSQKNNKENEIQTIKSNKYCKSYKFKRVQDQINQLSGISDHSQRMDEEKDTDENENDKEDEEPDPPCIKKYAHKVPGFISGVTDFLKEYNISIKDDSKNTTTRTYHKTKK